MRTNEIVQRERSSQKVTPSSNHHIASQVRSFSEQQDVFDVATDAVGIGAEEVVLACLLKVGLAHR
jgi:hypothetical protein